MTNASQQKHYMEQTGLLHKAVVHSYTSDKNNQRLDFLIQVIGGVNRPI